MRAETTKKLVLEFSGDEVDHIKSIVTKITEEATKTGFNRVFDKDEVTLIKDMGDRLKTTQ